MPAPPVTPAASPAAGARTRLGEEWLVQIAENIDEMLWVWEPQTGRLTYANPAFERFWGVSAAELAAAPLCWLARVHEEDRERVAGLQRESGQNETGEYRASGPGGALAWLRERALPVRGPKGELLRVTHLASDVTSHRTAAESLAASEAKYRAVVENVNEGILVTAAGRILYANPKALALTGLDEETAKSRPFIEFIHPDDRERVLGNHLRRLRGEAVENYYQFRVVHMSGDIRWLEISAVVFEWQGAPATLNFLTDVTLKRQVEQDIRSALERERELSELKSRFVAVASHEFRTPLAAILSSVELLTDYGPSLPPQERDELLVMIKTAVKRMNSMVEQVLLTSALESGKFKFEPAPLALPEVFEQIVAEVSRGEAQAARIALRCDGLDHERVADERLLRHILANLLGNALKYSPPGTPVRLDAHVVDDRLHFSIADQGIGIPQADLPRLFETFHRGTNVGNIKGTGIGLHIVKECVELHQGQLEVQSDVGQGTTFRVQLHAPAAPG